MLTSVASVRVEVGLVTMREILDCREVVAPRKAYLQRARLVTDFSAVVACPRLGRHFRAMA